MNHDAEPKISPANEAAKKRRREAFEKARRQLAEAREENQRALVLLEAAMKLRSRRY